MVDSFEEKTNSIRLKYQNSNGKDLEQNKYIVSLLDDLLFKSGCIKYRHKIVLDKKSHLDAIAKQQEITLEEQLRNEIPGPIKPLRGNKVAIDEIKVKIERKKEIDSREVFYEFEALLLE